MTQLEESLRLLLIVPKETSYVKDHESLVIKMTTHHKDYYTVKWAAAHEDILSFFNPVWLSPLENAYLWVTGWKPSMAFRLVVANSELSDEQCVKLPKEPQGHQAMLTLDPYIQHMIHKRLEVSSNELEFQRVSGPLGSAHIGGSRNLGS
uniref:TGACG-sequence-specific DNA-binding protein TGA-2.1-like n=1 Tax=Nicotiana sylvestris TaxID=4096 RepID=A0A1U7WHT7_NICSY|nr:PREDICTED: TGACG-sequence-specific DNA-binding protein TGA-2.1-like [Nicotiana sylvestris]